MQKPIDPHPSAAKNLYIFQTYCSATWAYVMLGEAGSFVEDTEVNIYGLQKSPRHMCKPNSVHTLVNVS